jgi:hypothetical protein
MTTSLLLLFACIIVVPGLIIFLFFGLEPSTRYFVRKTGQPARAVILERRYGRWATYTGSEHNASMTSQQVILKLEVHPLNDMPYTAEDKFMAKGLDMLRLSPGCEIQVAIAKNNPKRVVCLPETVSAPADASAQARTGLAMADIAEQVARGGSASQEQVLQVLQAHGVQTSTPSPQENTRAKLEELKAMLDAGLIDQSDFDSKKKDLLAKM